MRTLTGPLSVEDVLSGMTAAVELTPAAVEMCVLLIAQNRKFETHAATSRHVHHPHVLRERFCNGSALQATLYGAPIVCTHDFQAECRWPKYSRAVVDLGDPQRHVGQAVNRRGRTAGMLSLFGTEPGAFDCESGTIGAVLGSHGAAALQASCAREQLESALASRDVIGQAKGILMGRFTVDSSHAFGLLYTSRAPMPTVARRAGRRLPRELIPLAETGVVLWSWEKTVTNTSGCRTPTTGATSDAASAG